MDIYDLVLNGNPYETTGPNGNVPIGRLTVPFVAAINGLRMSQMNNNPALEEFEMNDLDENSFIVPELLQETSANINVFIREIIHGTTTEYKLGVFLSWIRKILSGDAFILPGGKMYLIPERTPEQVTPRPILEALEAGIIFGTNVLFKNRSEVIKAEEYILNIILGIRSIKCSNSILLRPVQDITQELRPTLDNYKAWVNTVNWWQVLTTRNNYQYFQQITRTLIIYNGLLTGMGRQYPEYRVEQGTTSPLVTVIPNYDTQIVDFESVFIGADRNKVNRLVLLAFLRSLPGNQVRE